MSESKSVAKAWENEMENMRRAIFNMNVEQLKKSTRVMINHGRNLKLASIVELQLTERDSAKTGVKIFAHPLCLFLERIKLMPENVMDATMRVVFGEWQSDLNMVFEVVETRPDAPPGMFNSGDELWRMSGRLLPQLFLKFDITSNPISWLFYLRYVDRRNDHNVQACMRQLLERGADANAPFHFTITERPGNPPMKLPRRLIQKVKDRDAEYAALNGHSLLYAAMQSRFDLKLIELLFMHGARFNQKDKSPFATFMYTYCSYPHNDDSLDVVMLFHKYWRLGQVTDAEILSPEELVQYENEFGDTAMHLILQHPSEKNSEAALQMLLEMGFTPSTVNGAGNTVAQCAAEMISGRQFVDQRFFVMRLKLAHRVLEIEYENQYAIAKLATSFLKHRIDGKALPAELVDHNIWNNFDLGPCGKRPSVPPKVARAEASRAPTADESSGSESD